MKKKRILAVGLGAIGLAAAVPVRAVTIYAVANGNWDSDIWSTNGSTVTPGVRPGQNSGDIPYTTGTQNRAITLDSAAVGTVAGWSNKSNGGLLTIENGAVLNWTAVYENALTYSTSDVAAGTTMTGGTITGGSNSIIKVAHVNGTNAAANVTGIFDQSGGTVTTQTLELTERSGTGATGTPTGTYKLSGNGILNIKGNLDPGTGNTDPGAGTVTAKFNFTGGTLNYNGLKMNLTNAGGTLAPGGVGAVGTSQLNGDGATVGFDYTQNSGTLAIDIASNGFDQLLGTGSTGSNNVTLNGTLLVNLLGGFTPAEGQTFDIVTTGDLASSSITDNTTLTLGLGSGFFTKSVVAGTGNSDILRLTYSSVPEPGSLSLLAVGGLWALRRRRRQA